MGSVLLSLVDRMINFQYKQQPDYWVIGGKMMSAVPSTSICLLHVGHTNKSFHQSFLYSSSTVRISLVLPLKMKLIALLSHSS